MSILPRWFRFKTMTREQLLSSRFVRPFAHRLDHPLLWHMNRRAVAKGIALGLFAGFMLPLGQIVLAAFLAVFLRANVLVATTATLVTNPLTFPPIYFAAYKLGQGILGSPPAQGEGEATQSWLRSFQDIGSPTLLGLLLFALTSALIGYAVVHLGWRWHLTKRWRRRQSARAGL